MNTVKQRGRPKGWRKAGAKQRRDYRFAPTTIALLNTRSVDETAYVEAAIAHYTALLAGQDATEIDTLQAKIRELQDELRQAEAQILLQQQQIRNLAQEITQTKAQTSETVNMKQAQKQRKEGEKQQSGVANVQEPRIILSDLTPRGTMASYWLKWEQDGLLATASLDPIDERSSASGYRLDSLCSSVARPGRPLGSRQEKQAAPLVNLARTRLIEELRKAGWQPDNANNAEKAVWRWRGVPKP